MTRRRSTYKESCWSYRTSLEFALLGVVLILVFFIVTVMVMLSIPIPKVIECNNPQCIIEASRIVEHLNFTSDPCEDFHKFSCGWVSENSKANELLVERQLLELYGRPFESGEHRLVGVAKKLFAACMDEDSVERDGLRSISEVIQAVGGWPAAEGLDWDDSRFSWTQATYRLRKLGYPFDAFLDLGVVEDPRSSNRSIFEVSIPVQKNAVSLTDQDRSQFMTDVAVAFNASWDDALGEMKKTIDFMKRLYQFQISNSISANNKSERIYSVHDFQQKLGSYVSLLEFTNTIVHPVATVAAEDELLFPEPDTLHKWFNIISKTSKRDQANYMIWRLIEETTPYLPRRLRNRRVKPTLMPPVAQNEETRAQFCMRETQERFSPSPLNQRYINRYLTDGNKRKAEAMVDIIKEIFIENVHRISWIADKDKRKIGKNVQKMEVVLGAPHSYLIARIFDEWTTEMPETKADTFLSQLAQASRHHRTNHFNMVHQSRKQTRLSQWYLGPSSLLTYIQYNPEDNVLRIPVPMLQGTFFSEERPNYFNFGVLGVAVAQEFVKLLDDDGAYDETDGVSNGLMDATKSRMDCLTENSNLGKSTILELQDSLTLKIVYESYKKWLIKNAEEAALVATKYTGEQIFWITSAYTICQSKEPFGAASSNGSGHFALLGLYPSFGQDFSCPSGSRMNQRDTCQIL